MTHWDIADTEYPAVRSVMGPERERMNDEQLEELLESIFPESDPGEVEGFMKTLRGIAKQAAPIVQQVAPAMAKGAMSGAAVGGPWGALIGGLGGGASSLIGGAARPKPPAGPAPGPLPSRPAPVAQPMSPGPVAAPAATGLAGSAATAQLLTLLARPETMQALLALLMGHMGRATVAVGEQHHVPVTAFADAIAELAGEAAGAPGSSPYWFDPQGEPRTDLANPHARATLLWRDVAEAAESESGDEADEFATDAHESWDQSDALEAFEAALAGDNYDDD